MLKWLKKNQATESGEVEAITVQLSKQQVKEKEHFLKGLMNQEHLPLVVLDASWYNVKALIQNDHITKNEQILLEHVKEQGKLTNKIKEDNTVKQNFMHEVLETSQRLSQGDEAAVGDLERLQQGIVKISDELKEDERRLTELETLIKTVNAEILEEAVAIAYEYMEVCKSTSSTLTQEIDQLRETMMAKAVEKKKYDGQANLLYNYLHNIVGYKHIDKLDKILGDK